MKKLFVLLLCLIAVFALASCKNEPEQNATPEQDNTPAEPEFEEPDWESGVIRIMPAEGADSSWEQKVKLQFKMAVSYSAGEPIEFKLKCSDDITGIEIREVGNGDTFFIPKETPLSNWEKDSDGWYIITVPGEKVIPVAEPCMVLGVTARVPADSPTRAVCYVAFKDMKINNVPVDFTQYVGNELSFISPYSSSPSDLDVYIEE